MIVLRIATLAITRNAHCVSRAHPQSLHYLSFPLGQVAFKFPGAVPPMLAFLVFLSSGMLQYKHNFSVSYPRMSCMCRPMVTVRWFQQDLEDVSLALLFPTFHCSHLVGQGVHFVIGKKTRRLTHVQICWLWGWGRLCRCCRLHTQPGMLSAISNEDKLGSPKDKQCGLLTCQKLSTNSCLVNYWIQIPVSYLNSQSLHCTFWSSHILKHIWKVSI